MDLSCCCSFGACAYTSHESLDDDDDDDDLSLLLACPVPLLASWRDDCMLTDGVDGVLGTVDDTYPAMDDSRRTMGWE